MDWEAFYNHFREKDFVAGYEIQNRLGGGAFGEVYKVRKHSIGKAYAIKFLKIDDDEQRGAVERELDQVRHFAAIDHPNLVTIEDLGTVMGVPYLIMGYAGEETLARVLRQRQLDPDSALRYFVQVCRGVLALHDRRLVHFDLKPSNIFLKGDIARVGDYGLSKMMSDGRSTLSFGRGTPQYMAPEMLRNRADHRADLYSLGVILYESIHGQLPFESSVPGTLSIRESDEPPPFPAGFPLLLRVVVERSLRLFPDDRYASVSELLEDLGQTARPGDSVRIDWTRVPSVRARSAAIPAAPASAQTSSPSSETRQAAAQFARGAVEVARGVWDGLRTASTRAPSTFGTERERETSAPSPSPAEPIASATDRELVIHRLSDGRSSALEVPGPRPVRMTWTANAGTIPVPPPVEGGLRGTLAASFALAVEVLVAVARTVLRGATRPLRTQANALGAQGFVPRTRSLALRAARMFVFILLMLLLGGLATVGAVLLWSRSSA